VDVFSVLVRSRLRGIREALASVVFPAPCRICARMLETGNRIPFCRTCLATLTQKLSEPQCARCGRPIVSTPLAQGASPPQCRLCRSGAYDFDFVRSFGAYTPSMAHAILLLKYSEITPLGGWFAGQLARLAEGNREGFAADLVIFDENTVGDKATFDQPHQYAQGFQDVIVNGKVVFDGTKMTGAMPGEPLYGKGLSR